MSGWKRLRRSLTEGLPTGVACGIVQTHEKGEGMLAIVGMIGLCVWSLLVLTAIEHPGVRLFGVLVFLAPIGLTLGRLAAMIVLWWFS